MSVKIVTDSTCDLPDEIISACGITVVPLYINVGAQSYLDGVELTREEFYEQLPGYSTPPTTSAPGPGVFARVYDQLAAGGATEIVSIHISSTLSAVWNAAQLAAEATRSAPVSAVDSGQLTLGVGLLVLAAAEAAGHGARAAEIVQMLEETRPRVHSFAALDTLEFLRRSGRVSRLQSSLGTALQVKPLLKMNNGEMGMERIRTRRRAVERVIELVEELGPLKHLALVHTHAAERAEALRRQVAHMFPHDGMALSAYVTPVIGAHVGPGAVGLVAMTA